MLSPEKGAYRMLRLQAPLPERYTAATDDELATMIGEAKAALGSRRAGCLRHAGLAAHDPRFVTALLD